MISSVTVYCSSSSKVDPVYLDAAADLGRAIAAQGWTLIYGGNYCGCMGALADGARHGKGKVVGVTPKLLMDKVAADEKCDELIVTQTMRERKGILEDRADAFITLPGGLGTFEEFFEILVGRALGAHHKPVVLLNVAGFYDPMLDLLRRGVETHFIREKALDVLYVATSVEDAVGHLRAM